MIRDAFKWLSLPALLLALVLASKAFEFGSGTDSTVAALEGMDQDRKLRRTIEHFDVKDSPAASAYLVQLEGRPGLRLDLGLDAVQLEHLARTKDWSDKRVKKKFHVPIAFDGGPARAARIKVHGDSTLKKDRKSLAVDLFDTKLLGGSVALPRFFLIALQNDPGEHRMIYCYSLLAELGLFPNFFAPVTVYINGDPQGIYLLVERSADAIIRAHPETVSVFRRTGRSSVAAKFERAVPDPRMTMIRLKRAYEETEGEDARRAFEQLLNLDQYCTLLAFNSLVKNRDSSDEIFFYELRASGSGSGVMNLTAWDFDDIMRPPKGRREAIDDDLLYAAESDLDKAIKSDDALYERFRSTFARLIEEEWTEAHLMETLDRVHVMLDGIDAGFDEETAKAKLAERDAMIAEFRRLLLARRAELVEILSPGPKF